ncbi:DUF6199 family natural product biosynthesis protein [Paenibacillus radicibacter]|uniref:DUF6199 family natural product biosynthesis protein n=1 Tax=Paenibacillus radicibacter TaxID=2972488 RepID=UPI00358DF958
MIVMGNGVVAMILFGIIFTIVGGCMLLFPAVVWLITESWKSNDATEPSDLYKFSTRFGGVCFFLIGLFILFKG